MLNINYYYSMSLVENIIDQITTSGLSGITKTSAFNMNDDTFANLLNKQISAANHLPQNNLLGEMGMPAGMIIEPFENTEPINDKIVEMNKVQEAQPIEIKDIKMGDYFSEYLSNKDNIKSPIMNMAIKQASNHYSVFGKNLVTDIDEFTEDLKSLL